jgi:hypothetical protein
MCLAKIIRADLLRYTSAFLEPNVSNGLNVSSEKQLVSPVVLFLYSWWEGNGFDSRWDPFLMWSRVGQGRLSDSVGFLRGHRFPPTYITNRPILSMELIMSSIDAQLSIQYFNLVPYTNGVCFSIFHVRCFWCIGIRSEGARCLNTNEYWANEAATNVTKQKLNSEQLLGNRSAHFSRFVEVF